MPLRMIDDTIICTAKKDDVKTNESTIKAAAPRGALRTFCNLISGFIHITSELVFVKVYVRGQGNMTFQQLESQAHDYRLKPPAVLEPNGTGICRNICI